MHRPLARLLALALIMTASAVAFIVHPASAGSWSFTDVATPSGDARSVDSVRFAGSTYTTYTGTSFRPFIMRHDANGQPATHVQLPGSCDGHATGFNAGISTVVAYGQLHVFSGHPIDSSVCHAWSTDGQNYSFEYLATGLSTNEGISTALWTGQLHVIARGIGGGVQHTWYDPVQGAWSSEKIDRASVIDDMSEITESRIGLYNNQFHAIYMTPTDRIIDLWWDPTSGVWNRTSLFSGLTLDGDGFSGLDVETTYANQFHITYRDNTTGYLTHAWYDPTAGRWSENVMDDGSGGRHAAEDRRIKTFVYAGQWHAVFGDAVDDGLGHFWWDQVAGRWRRETLDVGPSDPDFGLDAIVYGSTLDIYSSKYAGTGLRQLRYG